LGAIRGQPQGFAPTVEFRYTYDNDDDEGNRISKTSLTTGEKTAYNWDHRNRLIGVTIGSGRKKQQVQYRYDYMNRLTRRNDEFFVHNGWQFMLTFDTKGNIQNRYLWGARQDELLCEKNIVYYFVDCFECNLFRFFMGNRNDGEGGFCGRLFLVYGETV
jgi:YD repeat-containing protein